MHVWQAVAALSTPLLVAAAALLSSSLLAGCSSSGTGEEPAPAQQQAAPTSAAGTTAAAAPPTRTDQGRSVEERIEDASLAAQVKTALVENRQLRTFDFEPRVTGGRVTLAGNVATRAQGQAAAEVAGEVDGVEDVLNRLTVDGQQVAWAEPETSNDEQVASSQAPDVPGPSDGSASGSTYHTVQTGESLWSIANEHGTSVSRIRTLNNLRSNNLRAGERLLVKQGSGAANDASSGGGAALAGAEPSTQQQGVSAGVQDAPPQELSFFKGGTSESTPPDEAPAPAEEETTEYYEVKSGESLWAIARKNNITVAQLKELNGLTSNNLMPGDRLRVE